MKTAVKHLLKFVNRELRAVDSPMRSFARGVERLSHEISPHCVIDVGVAEGTPDLYKHFPSQRYLLVEANPVYHQHLARLSEILNAAVENVFCGEDVGTAQLISYSDPRKSSIFETTRSLRVEKTIAVPVEPLDLLVERHQLTGPFLLKIDVEGAELAVIRGATETLRNCEAVIAEASILPKFKGGPEFADLVQLMSERGFAVYDILAGVNHPKTGSLFQVDLIFVKKDASVRWV